MLYLLGVITREVGCIDSNLWCCWGCVVWVLLSRTVVLQLWHSIWYIHVQKANIVRHPWCWFCSWMVQSFLIYMGKRKHGMKKFQFAFDGFGVGDLIHWHVSFDVVAHAFCVCISSKVKIFCSLSVSLEVHMFSSWNQVAIFLQL